ncbi:MAG: hypothetical protein Q7N50_05240 [Armatimonadota bacterium]|nr:hypothetical protein [Armatimonadota bacterium]
MRYRSGDQITLPIDREGLGLDEGIGHLPDETMVVVVGAGARVGQSVDVVVTNVLQTSLGECLLASAK